ncbi:helix-turn-helix domain-containing protein [Catenulispora yoronensis]|uniref:Helix-turn-helix domain-containing protein n=1 Tax=Catenulispora yoronensis TaxID=450799 RepID=A0ABN2TJN3_9ACTN
MFDQLESWRRSAHDVGPTREEEDVYLELCRRGTASIAELAEALTVRPEEVLRSLAGLHGRRFVRMSDSGARAAWFATAPDVALEGLLSGRERADRDLHAEITRLLDGYHQERCRRDPGRSDLVEVVTGREAITEVWLSLLAGARQEVAVLVQEPFVQDDVMSAELEVLGRGVAWRSVYERATLLEPENLAQVRLLMAAGETAAVVTDLPFKLAVVDRRWALIPVASGAELDGALVVRPSPMLDALMQTLETQWARAMPLPGSTHRDHPRDHPGGDAGPEADDHPEGGRRRDSPELLTMLTAGMTDDAIARQLQVSARTIQRRVSELMKELGARNRFQAGVQAVRRGLL